MTPAAPLQGTARRPFIARTTRSSASQKQIEYKGSPAGFRTRPRYKGKRQKNFLSNPRVEHAQTKRWEAGSTGGPGERKSRKGAGTMCCSLKGTYKALASAWPDGFFVLSTVCRTTEKHEATNVLQRSRKSKDDEQRRFNQCPLPEKEKKTKQYEERLLQMREHEAGAQHLPALDEASTTTTPIATNTAQSTATLSTRPLIQNKTSSLTLGHPATTQYSAASYKSPLCNYHKP